MGLKLMRGKDILALIILAVIGLVIGGLALWFILQYLPLIAALILAFIVAFFVILAVAAFVGFFTAAVGALYYSIVKRPQIAGRPMSIKDVKRINKEKGTFRREEESSE